jgi:hypothetical protein
VPQYYCFCRGRIYSTRVYGLDESSPYLTPTLILPLEREEIYKLILPLQRGRRYIELIFPSRGRRLSRIFKDSFNINNFKMIFDIFIFIYFFG